MEALIYYDATKVVLLHIRVLTTESCRAPDVIHINGLHGLRSNNKPMLILNFIAGVLEQHPGSTHLLPEGSKAAIN